MINYELVLHLIDRDVMQPEEHTSAVHFLARNDYEAR